MTKSTKYFILLTVHLFLILGLYAIYSVYQVEGLSWLFIFLIVGFFEWGIVDIARDKRNVSIQSTISLSLGMLGTFVGIVMGLNGFDTSDIPASVPTLLAGMKTAFWTSIVGMMSNIILRGVSHFVKDEQLVEQEASLPEMMVSLLNEIARANIDNTKAMKSLEKAIVGDKSSLVSTVESMKKATDDNLHQLVRAFNDFAKMQAEQNSKALIEALNDIMINFNTKLNEQFGQNFLRLNEGVGKMLEWQQEYRNQIDEMIEHFKYTLDGLKTTQILIKDISATASAVLEQQLDVQVARGRARN